MPAVVQLNSGNFCPKIRAFQPCNLILRFARILRQIARIFIRKVPETGGAGAPPSHPPPAPTPMHIMLEKSCPFLQKLGTLS